VSITPEYGEEENVREQSGFLRQQSEAAVDQQREAGEVAFLEPDANAAHAPGQVCGLCGRVITENQEARRRANGTWIHEACPVDFGDLGEGQQGIA
jgi:hypothetical protein